MARKAVHLQPAGSLTPRDRIWTEIRRQKEFSFESIEDKTCVCEDTIRSYVGCLVNAGILECVVEGGNQGGRTARYTQSRWRLVQDSGVSTPRFRPDGKPVTQGSAQQNMWRSLRMLDGNFTWKDLVLIASTEEAPIAASSAKTYLKFLTLAGYVRTTAPGSKKGLARHRFIASKYTGPKAPMVQRIKHVWDPNLGKVVWSPKPEEVADEQQ